MSLCSSDRLSLLCHVHHCSIWKFPNLGQPLKLDHSSRTHVSLPGNAWSDRHCFVWTVSYQTVRYSGSIHQKYFLMPVSFRCGSSIPSSVLSQVFCWLWLNYVWHWGSLETCSYFLPTNLHSDWGWSDTVSRCPYSSVSHPHQMPAEHHRTTVVSHSFCETGHCSWQQKILKFKQDLWSFCGFHYTWIRYNLHCTFTFEDKNCLQIVLKCDSKLLTLALPIFVPS